MLYTYLLLWLFQRFLNWPTFDLHPVWRLGGRSTRGEDRLRVREEFKLILRLTFSRSIDARLLSRDIRFFRHLILAQFAGLLTGRCRGRFYTIDVFQLLFVDIDQYFLNKIMIEEFIKSMRALNSFNSIQLENNRAGGIVFSFSYWYVNSN